MTNTHEGLTQYGVMFTCSKCGASAALRRAIRANDWQTVRFISAHAPTEHAADCEAVRHPLFEILA